MNINIKSFWINFIIITLTCVSLSCSRTTKNNDKTISARIETYNAIVDSLAKGNQIVMNDDIEISNEGDFMIKLNGKPYTGRVFSTKSVNGKSVAFEEIVEGKNIVGFEVYFPNGQKAYECKGDLSYDGHFYAPDGSIIDFYEFAEKYYDVWCRHEGYLPVTLICPACILDQMEYEEDPSAFNAEESARHKLIKKYGGLEEL